MKYSIWMVEQAFSGLLYLWPVTILLLTASTVGLIVALIKYPQKFRKTVALNLLPLLGTMAILASGAIFEKDEEFVFVPYLGGLLVIVLIGVAIFKQRNFLYAALPISAFLVWVSFWFWLVSVMSIIGDWM